MTQPARRIKVSFLLRNYISVVTADRLHKLSTTDMLWKAPFYPHSYEARTLNKGEEAP